jgi:hypothetical protein
MATTQEIYEHARQWSDAYLPKVKSILGEHLFRISTFQEDTERASDLMILKGALRSVGVRLRRPGYSQRYPWDFTIRWRTACRVKTEYEKILEGSPDIFFYGHVDQSDEISRWFILDLAVFRQEMRSVKDPQRIGKLIDNRDGTFGLGFDIRRFPKNLLIAASHSPHDA